MVIKSESDAKKLIGKVICSNTFGIETYGKVSDFVYVHKDDKFDCLEKSMFALEIEKNIEIIRYPSDAVYITAGADTQSRTYIFGGTEVTIYDSWTDTPCVKKLREEKGSIINFLTNIYGNKKNGNQKR